jgi:hypothetical protein
MSAQSLLPAAESFLTFIKENCMRAFLSVRRVCRTGFKLNNQIRIMEQYSARSLVRTVSYGMISAITAVNLRQEGNSDFDEYDKAAKSVLEQLSDGENELYRAFPQLRERIGKNVKKANELYPNIEALPHLTEIMFAVK